MAPDYDGTTGKYVIDYDDGDQETLHTKYEIWRSLQANQFDISKTSTIHRESLKMYHHAFDHKEFILYTSEDLPPHPTWNAYNG